MKLPSVGLTFSLFLSLGLLGLACANGDTVSGGTGSPSGTAGTTGSGNTTGQAGTTGSGNTTGRAGTTGTGNVTGQAGTTGSGNTTGRAGTTGTGNVTGQAGTTGTGNVTGQAGTTGTGNVTGTGTAGTAGTTCGSSFMAAPDGFVTMPVKSGGCWSGYAYTYVDTYGSTVSPMSPTPGYSACGSPCKLAMTGMIKAVTGTSYSFEGLGFGLGQISGGTSNATVTPTGTGLTIAFVNTTPATLPLRAQITDGTTTWCYTITGASPAVIPYAMFNTMCYDSPPDGTAYAKGPINAIQLQIAGGTAPGTVGVTITSVTEN